MKNEQVTVNIPLALRQLILNSNELLTQYQNKLLAEIEDANVQMMHILNLDTREGWTLDMKNMVYTRPRTPEELGATTQPTESEPVKKTTK
jgi:hypothetical protein